MECGYPADVSTVTVAGAEAPHNINDHGSIRPESILTTVAETMAVVGCNNATGGGQPVVVFGPEHAATVAAEGFTKQDVRAWLFEHARIDIGRFSLENAAHFLGEDAGASSSQTRVPVASSAQDLIVLVAGRGRQAFPFHPHVWRNPRRHPAIGVAQRHPGGIHRGIPTGPRSSTRCFFLMQGKGKLG